jgi:hypothetical protein
MQKAKLLYSPAEQQTTTYRLFQHKRPDLKAGFQVVIYGVGAL